MDHASRRRPGAMVILLAVVSAAWLASCAGQDPGAAAAAWPWGTNAIAPAEFARELASTTGADKPVVVCVAPAFMYRNGHIPGAAFHGPAGSPEGLNDLTAWAQPLPRSTSIVIYCGCCPLRDCPNIQPAYTALKGMGFTRVRVLLIPDNFKTDWIDRGYPFER